MNNCYPEIQCTVVPGTCSGLGDASADYTCLVNLQYFADPTDSNTLYTAENWLTSVKATDKNSATGTSQISSGVNVNSLVAFDLTNSINYGGLSVGQSISPLNQISTMTSLGNVGLNHELSGSSNMCTDFPTCAEGTPIAVSNQRYSLLPSTAYSEGNILTDTPVEVLLRIPKPISTSATSGDTYWGILIPTGTLAGTYSGQNYITAVKSAIEFWNFPL